MSEVQVIRSHCIFIHSVYLRTYVHVCFFSTPCSTPGRRKRISAVQPLQPVTVVPLSSDTETIDIITP